jgi:3-methyl-2-oxobutanoate hydroxymethyltransferase
MSSAPPVLDTLPMTLPRLAEKKRLGEPIVMVTAYDHPSARVADAAGVDLVLVGDSAANVVLGHPSTVAVTTDELLVLVKAVRRGVRRALLVADLPFGSYEVSDEDAVRAAIRFVKEGGADAVKIERGGTSVARARAIVAAGIPVMGHVGLTPQTATALGGYRAQGRVAAAAVAITDAARDLEAAGCFCVVVEAVPAPVAARIAELLEVPVIGIGAGGEVDGQVLVLHDLLGLSPGRPPKFVRRYADIAGAITDAVGSYAAEVRAGAFPAAEHAYPMSAAELRRYLDGDEHPADG